MLFFFLRVPLCLSALVAKFQNTSRFPIPQSPCETLEGFPNPQSPAKRLKVFESHPETRFRKNLQAFGAMAMKHSKTLKRFQANVAGQDSPAAEQAPATKLKTKSAFGETG
ncbi:MAG: hypothetical protein J0H55_17045 [Chitinophagaceae bacterium]|nr:hypothetical protein [Chitinophagaceae bacterium]